MKIDNQLLKLKHLLLILKSGSHHHKNIYPQITNSKSILKARINKKLVHAGTSRHQDMEKKIQSKLEQLAHPEIRYNEDWLELRLS